MARAHTDEISPSSSSFHCPYDVFLSFRGEDTRTNFTDHLYTALTEAKLHVFRDDDEIERGMNVELELKRAIEQSRISIVVFSKNYASSRSCLDELVRILHQKKAVEQQVLPVFYYVSPSEVRNQTGNFKKAFEEHERIFRTKFGEYEDGFFDKMNEWRRALKEAADLGGFVLENQTNRHEASFIKDHIIPAVLQKINPKVLSEPHHLIGIDGQVKKITSWLQDGSFEVGILAIHGMGGIGKTTIAKVIYNLNFNTFDDTCFLEDIREISRTFRGLVRVQKHLLSNIYKGRKPDIDNVDQGITLITKALSHRRTLLILDDIDEEDQLDVILRQYHLFCSGSKIIITTRDASLVRAYSTSKLHTVGTLADKEALELFSWHAFKQKQPIEGYMELSKRAIKYCGGVPLSLQVLGSSLCHINIDIWTSALVKFEAIPHRKIIEKLRVSFECLPDDSLKNLFLDISCFFLGEDKDYVAKILEKCNLFPTYGFQILMERCLLNIDAKNKLKMHRLLGDMGREIVRQESIDNPGKRSRIWQYQDSFDVLKGRTGTSKIRGLSLDMCLLNKDEKAHEVGTHGKKDELKSESFASIQRLGSLPLNYVYLVGSFEVISKEIRWLCWHGFSQKHLPDDFNLEKVVAIDMQYSTFKYAWKGIKFLGWLKFLNLNYSNFLVKTPNFNGVPNLERITLKFCTSLMEIHDSIVKLKGLLVLNLRGCTSLRKFPKDIHQMKSLKKLIISGCSKLSNKLPEELGNMPSLEVLDATGIGQSLFDTQKLRLWHIFLYRLSTLRRSHAFTQPSLPQSLTVLRLRESNISDHILPKNLGNLSLLHILDLSHNPIQSIPKSIKHLKKLVYLDITGCNKLLTVPDLPCNLSGLSIAECKSLKKLANIRDLFKRFYVLMHGCPVLTEVEKLFKLQRLENIGVEMMQNLGLEDIEPLKSLNVNLLNLMTGEANYFPIQVGLLEFGIFSIFLPGNRIPHWFSNYRNVKFSIEKELQDEDNCSVSFAMPPLPDMRFQGLNIGVVYSYGNHGGIYHLVQNRTKDIGWVYSPTFSVAANSNEVIFLSHWNVENLFEVGDELEIRLSGLKMKKIEIQLVYFQDNQCTTLISLQNLMDKGNLLEYECSHGRHFLCHYHFRSFKCPEDIIRLVLRMMIMGVFEHVEENESMLHQYLINSLGLQDSRQITFADLQKSYILRFISPLLVAVDYHFRQSPCPISYSIVEMTALLKWLICYPEFVPDLNFIQGCHHISLAVQAKFLGRIEMEHVQKAFKEAINKLSWRSIQIGQDKFVVNNLWLEDGSYKVEMCVVHGIDGMGNTTIAKFVYNLEPSLIESCSIVENIEETSEELNGLVHFQ